MLDRHRWEERVILLFAPEADYPNLLAQLDTLAREEAGMRERHLVTYQVLPAGGKQPSGKALEADDARSLRRRFRINAEDFVFLLIGKDGGSKLRESNATVSLERLFGLIDQMPMRRAEMQRQDNKQ